MNWLATLFSGGDTVKALGDTVDKLFTSDDERLERQNELAKAQMTYDLEVARLDAQALQNQTDIDKVEAANTNLFVSGWRPFVGWVCGFALAYVAILEPLLSFIVKVGFDYSGEFPKIDTTITMQVLMGMLGLGGLRSFEKVKGVASK
jgi:hypothetical protein